MAVINDLPTQGGGKWELLWTNPNPNAGISSAIVQYMDLTPYERIFVAIKASATATDIQLVEHIAGQTHIGVFQKAEDWVGYRYMMRDDNHFEISGPAGFVYITSGKGEAITYCIPVAVYGVKRLNLG